MNKLQQLSQIIKQRGTQQKNEVEFINTFATKLKTELSEYLGQPDCVFFANDQSGSTDDDLRKTSSLDGPCGAILKKDTYWEISYFVRIPNLDDDGATLIRLPIQVTDAGNTDSFGVFCPPHTTGISIVIYSNGDYDLSCLLQVLYMVLTEVINKDIS